MATDKDRVVKRMEDLIGAASKGANSSILASRKGLEQKSPVTS